MGVVAEKFCDLTDDKKAHILREILPHRPAGYKLRDFLDIPKGEKGFDIDICEADIEPKLKDLLVSLDGVEVKVDYAVSESGNVAVEFECSGRPSGISMTTATHWLIVLSGQRYRNEVAVLIETGRLRDIAERCPTTSAGDGGRARIYIVPVTKLMM